MTHVRREELHRPRSGSASAPSPPGVKQAGAARRDLALIVSDAPCAAAGVFTVNRMRAAPVRLRRRAAARAADIRAIVANSGNANAIVGPRGAADERAVAEAVAEALGVDAGRRADRVDRRHRDAAAGRPDRRRRARAGRGARRRRDPRGRGDPHHRPAHEGGVPRDRRRRQGRQVRGDRQGVGDDPPAAWRRCSASSPPTRPSRRRCCRRRSSEAVEETFNTITVDGDMSTNDTVIALANGRAGRAGDRARQRRASPSCRRRWSACAAIWRAPSPPTARGPRKLLIVDVAGAPERADGARSGAGRRRRQPGEVRASSAAIRRGAASWPRSARASARATCRSTWRA